MDENTVERKEYVHTLKKEFSYEDKTFDKIEFNFDGMTGGDYIDILHELNANGIIPVSCYTDGKFLTIVAAKASGIASDILTAMPFMENRAVKNLVRDYLIPKKGEERVVNLDFDHLTGADADAIEDEFRAKNIVVVVPSMNAEYRIKLAAKASGETEKTLKALSMREYMQIDSEVQRFLLGLA
jgi:hypothetical protein